MNLQIKGLSHITLVCQDLEKTTIMLQTVLGAKQIYDSGENTFSIAKEKFFLIADIWIAIMQGEPVAKTYNHIAFQVNDEALEACESKARSFGLTILPGRKRESAEGRSLYFYDYDNHLFELHTGDLATRLLYYGAASQL